MPTHSGVQAFLNRMLQAQAKTGLVRNPWREIFNVTLVGPDNTVDHATGTTLHHAFHTTPA